MNINYLARHDGTHRRQRQENHEFEDSLGCIVRRYHTKKKTLNIKYQNTEQ
jgi:hypothetical protein